MVLIDKVMLACLGWGVLIAICNPWLENKKLNCISISLLIAATVIWVLT